MDRIKLHVKKFSCGLKSQLAILVIGIVVFIFSSTSAFAGLYLYSQSHQNNNAPTKTLETNDLGKTSGSVGAKKQATVPTAKAAEATKSTPKTQPDSKPAVVVQPVAPAPSSVVDSLTSSTTEPDPVIVDSSTNSVNPIRVSTTSYYSTNWSGYLATGGNFTAVSGSWTVPSVTGTAGVESADGAWIGIGGVTSNDLIQVGTLNQVQSDGTVNYGIFYEILPAAAMLVDMPVDAGDLISASITEVSVNQWLVVISDVTKGSTFSKNISYNSSHSSAEWVQEDPSYLSGDLMPFSNFGSINFYGCKATVDGYLYSIADIGASSVTMVAQGTPIAVPSAIYSSGFTVTES